MSKIVKGTVVSGLICVILTSIGCGSLPWSKKKDNIYSPKPAYKRLNKIDSQKSKGRPSETIDDYLGSPRPSW